MSTIHCSEQACLYQKDGLCYLNVITNKIEPHPSSACFYFYKAKNNETNPLKNEAQNP